MELGFLLLTLISVSAGLASRRLLRAAHGRLLLMAGLGALILAGAVPGLTLLGWLPLTSLAAGAAGAVLLAISAALLPFGAAVSLGRRAG